MTTNKIFGAYLIAFGSALAAGVLVTGLLLGASAAQAADVVIENGNVIRINNLELNLDKDEFDGFYNVELINGTGLGIYGSVDGPFDFPLAEDAATAITQVNNALKDKDRKSIAPS